VAVQLVFYPQQPKPAGEFCMNAINIMRCAYITLGIMCVARQGPDQHAVSQHSAVPSWLHDPAHPSRPKRVIARYFLEPASILERKVLTHLQTSLAVDWLVRLVTSA
jgi:hypothetical protein